MTIELLPLGFPHTTTRFSRGKTQRSELSNGQFSALVILRVSAALDKDGPGLVLETFPPLICQNIHSPGFHWLFFLSLPCRIFWKCSWALTIEYPYTFLLLYSLLRWVYPVPWHQVPSNLWSTVYFSTLDQSPKQTQNVFTCLSNRHLKSSMSQSNISSFVWEPFSMEKFQHIYKWKDI